MANVRFLPVGSPLPLRPGVKAGGWLAISGQVGHVDFALVEGGVVEQFRQAMDNMRTVVEEHGGQMSDIVKVNIYITNIEDFWTVNDVFVEYFESELPARTAIAVAALPFGALTELEGWAYLGN